MKRTQDQRIYRIKKLVRGFFKNASGEPYEMTDGQCRIFLAIINPKTKWLWISAPTRYGKSEILAMALIYLAVVKHLKIPVVAGSAEKAEKIMDYVVQHLPDHPELYRGLINLDVAEVEKLKVSMAKDKVRWIDGGWIYVTSVDSRNISKEGEGVVGEGGDIVVLEEAGLIKRKEQYSKIARMPEEDRGWGKLIMNGNCVENSVFEDAYNDPMFRKIRIDLQTAIREGRYSAGYLEQKKTQTTSKDWKRYFEVLFPEANEFTYFKPKTYDILPNNLKNYAFLDLALGETEKGSLVAVVVLGKDDKGQVYEVYSFGLILKPDETIRSVFNLPYIFERFGIEAVQFQKFFYQVIEAKSKELGKYIPFEPIQQKRKKEERIEGMEPFVNTGQILFKGEGELWEEMQDYPNCEHFDVLDALEGAWRVMGVGAFDFTVI